MVAIPYRGPEDNQFMESYGTTSLCENFPKKVCRKTKRVVNINIVQGIYCEKVLLCAWGMMAVKLTKRKATKINTLNAWAVPLYHCMKLVITKH